LVLAGQQEQVVLELLAVILHLAQLHLMVEVVEVGGVLQHEMEKMVVLVAEQWKVLG
jgi:hypothetical protein